MSVRLSAGLVTNAKPYYDAWILTASPYYNSNLVAPSKEAQIEPLPSSGFFNVTIVDSGNIKGLKDKLWLANGVN